jgi:hypothetical protein
MLAEQHLTTYQARLASLPICRKRNKKDVEWVYARESVLRTKFVRLVVSLDRLLVKEFHRHDFKTRKEKSRSLSKPPQSRWVR